MSSPPRILMALVPILAFTSIASAQDFRRAYALGPRTFVEIGLPSADHLRRARPRRSLGRIRGVSFEHRAIDAEQPAGTSVRLFDATGRHCDGVLGAPGLLETDVDVYPGVITDSRLVALAIGCPRGWWIVAVVDPAREPEGGRLWRLDAGAQRLAQEATRRLDAHAAVRRWRAARMPQCAKTDAVTVRAWRIADLTFVHVLMEVAGDATCTHLVIEGDLALDASSGDLLCPPHRPCADDPLVIPPPDGLHNCPVEFDQLVGYADFDGNGTPDVLQAWHLLAGDTPTTLTVHPLIDAGAPLLEHDAHELFRGYRSPP
jgi:hypothetical protein